ncbi:pentatricopeptide repeat-containing protein 1, mitochondrial-like [Argiope bruennichi]|uniref:Pentatricopeptide repeat-containing protein 1 n=1 Tax=Argiope bruennichi TaxID=94029 RepID=A0A8T0EMM4_ARGBR|nr:pentatricopeptide repeat-containing protein 1, mitochondrial-like [Argiope bruennichi]KAF8774858.1 Pentatricopeptide repeat-containing protein 1 [Argiope bruennichi]
MFFLRRNCGNVINRLIRSHEIGELFSEQRYCNVLTLNYSTLTSAEEIASNSKSDFSNEDSEDTFGSLQKRLERSKKNVRSKPSTDKKDVRIIKIKTKPKFDKCNDPDVFGNLSNKHPVWYPDINEEPILDNDQSDNSTFVRNISKQYRDPHVYLDKMKGLVMEKKLKEALELFIDMKRNYVAPLHAHYTFMIGACGKFGYTDMAFKLLRQMTDRGFQPTCATLTGLFNSCAETPFPDYGISKAKLLREKIKTKNWKLNQITYNSMIKAFGKCGDIQTAFQIVDEMAEAKIKIDSSTYCFLLMSCIADKEAGFTHAVEVWRKMKKRKCQPNLYTYNLLLRAVRDCDAGPKDISCLLLQHWSNYTNRPYGFKVKETLPKKEILLLSNTEAEKTEYSMEIDNELKKEYENEDSSSQLSETANTLPEKRPDMFVMNKIGNEVPSVLHSRPVSCTEIIDLGVIKTASDRLALIGGAENILIDMKKSKVKPSIKTFTLLLESLPPTNEAEEQLMALLDVYGVKPDVGFFNMLIKKRNYRFDYAAAHEVLALINKWSLSPDLITFGVLAVGCTNHQKATIFVNDMRKLGYTPNIAIAGALLRNACEIADFRFIEDTLKLLEESELYPDEKILKTVEDCLDNARKNIIDMEHGKNVSYIYKKEGFQKNYKEFCKLYEDWLKDKKLERPEHVWDQFRTNLFEKPIRAPSNVQVLE